MSRRTACHRLDDLSRRDLLVGGAKALLGVGMLNLFGALPVFAGDPEPAAPAPRPTAKNVIYLYMAGGMSHLDTFDPKPGSETQGPTKAIATSADGVQISEYLPKLAPLMKHVVVVRSLTSTQGAHEPGNYLMHTSYAQRGTIRHPALGAWVSFLSGRINGTLPGNVAIGAGSQHPGAGFLASRRCRSAMPPPVCSTAPCPRASTRNASPGAWSCASGSMPASTPVSISARCVPTAISTTRRCN